jgi:hypothetical protein
MKKFRYIIAIILTVFTAQVYAQTDKETIKRIVGEQNFNFVATRANPMPSNALNQILYRFPNSSNQIVDLNGSQYDLRVTKDSVVAYLPYFGRAFNASLDPKEAGTKFKSKGFKYSAVKKKNNWIITIDPKDVKDNQKLVLSVSESGYATLNVNNTNRQPISFNGYISENKSNKK